MEMDLEDSSSSSHISYFDARRAKKFKINHSGELPESEANNSIEIDNEDEDDYDYEWEVFTTNGYRQRRRKKIKNTRAKVRDGEIIKFDSGDIKHIPNSPSVSDCTGIMKVLRDTYYHEVKDINDLQSRSVEEMNKIEKKYNCGILANPTGTGKTKTCILYAKDKIIPCPDDLTQTNLINYIKTKTGSSLEQVPFKYYLNAVIIISPITLIENWIEEIKSQGCSYFVMHSSYNNLASFQRYIKKTTEKLCEKLLNAKFIILSNSGTSHDPLLELCKFKLVIAEESNKTLDYSNVIKYLYNSDIKWLVSATPFNMLEGGHKKKKTLQDQLNAIGFKKDITFDGKEIQNMKFSHYTHFESFSTIDLFDEKCQNHKKIDSNSIRDIDMFLLKEIVISINLKIVQPEILNIKIEQSESEKEIYKINWLLFNKINFKSMIFNNNSYFYEFFDNLNDDDILTLRNIWNTTDLDSSIHYISKRENGILTTVDKANRIASDILLNRYSLVDYGELSKLEIYNKIFEKIISKTKPLIELPKIKFILDKLKENRSLSYVNGTSIGIVYSKREYFQSFYEMFEKNNVRIFGFNGMTNLTKRNACLRSFSKIDCDLNSFKEFLKGATTYTDLNNNIYHKSQLLPLIGGHSGMLLMHISTYIFDFKPCVILLTPGVGTEGINLQNANLVFCPNIFTKNEVDQIKGRVGRYGQKKNPIVYNIAYKDTFEEDQIRELNI